MGRGGRILLRRAAPARRQRAAAQGTLDRRSAAALRSHRARAGGTRPGSQRDRAGPCLSRALPPSGRAYHATNQAGRQRPQAAGSARRGAPAPSADTGCSTRSEFLSPFGIRSLSRFHHDHPYRLPGRRTSILGVLPAGRIGIGQFRGQLELARSGMDADQSADRARTPQPAPLLWRELQGRMPDRLRPAAHAAEIAQEIARRLFAIFRRGPDGTRPLYGGSRDVPHATRIGATLSCSTSISTATTAPA